MVNFLLFHITVSRFFTIRVNITTSHSRYDVYRDGASARRSVFFKVHSRKTNTYFILFRRAVFRSELLRITRIFRVSVNY